MDKVILVQPMTKALLLLVEMVQAVTLQTEVLSGMSLEMSLQLLQLTQKMELLQVT